MAQTRYGRKVQCPSTPSIGVRQVINAWGPMTIIGSALVRPEVVTAMAEAAAWHVDVVELQRAAGRRLAQLIGVEGCFIAGGCSAGLAVATAATMTGGGAAKVARLPETSGMRNEVVMQRSHRNPYDHAFTQVGARIVEIGHAWQAFDWELADAIGPQTAAVIHVYGQRTMNLPLSLTETVGIAHAHNVPVIVDAAAEVPPAGNLRGLKDTGADVSSSAAARVCADRRIRPSYCVAGQWSRPAFPTPHPSTAMVGR